MTRSTAKLLHTGDEQRRRWNIIAASRARDARYVPQLLARLDSDETQANKRHIVRALGNIGDMRAEPALLDLLQTAHAPILGDVILALGQLKSRRAAPFAKLLLEHDDAWVRQNAKCMQKQMDKFQ